MKLTKKLEKEILEVYDTYWGAYLKGDMKTLFSYLDDDLKLIGSSDNEMFFNKKDAIKFYESTADQVTGKVEMRNRDIKIELVDGLILITEQLDLFVLVETEWILYSKCRLSSFLQKKQDGWKLIHQHGSLPDARAMEGEQFSIEKISAENIQLREAVKRRTAELETKNRELEIETSLERVRAVAMSMKKPDDMLGVCRIISEQLEFLKVKEIRNVQTAIIYESKGTYLNYEYYPKHDKLLTTEVDYRNHKLSNVFANKMLKSAGELFTETLDKKAVNEWYGYQKTTNQFIDTYLEEAEWLSYYFFSLGPVALGTSTYVPLTGDEIDLFKRFRNVFELAYRRFIDIQKAEAQTREAQIELGLERVRARAMAMQKSENLSQVVEVVFNELDKLELGILRCGIGIIDKEKRRADAWITSVSDEGKTVQVSGNESMDQHPLLQGAYDAWLNNTDFSYVLEGEDLVQYYKTSGVGKVRLPDSQLILSAHEITTQYYQIAVFEAGGLFAFSAHAFPEEAKMVMKRFAAVFNQSYTRFLDLQKAEAQAREAQIELALERVRARTMAMQKSDELPETSQILFQQMKELGEPSEQLSIGIVREAENIIEISATLHGDVLKKIYWHSIDEEYVMRKVFNAWKAKQKTLVIELRGEELNAYNRYRNELTGSEMFPTNLTDENRRIMYAAFFSRGMLAIAVNEQRPPESLQLLERFASVFHLTYTRFLDLQKAEAQTREAQIELGLERVRARAMAMQTSDELKELIATVYAELTKLDVALVRCLIWIMDNENLSARLWMANAESPLQPSSFYVPFHENPPYLAFVKAWKEKNPKWQYDLKGQEKKDWDDYVFQSTEMKHLPQPVKDGMKAAERILLAASFHQFGCLQTAGPEPLKEEHFEILNRFAKVFDLTYTRFRDLKQAEAQAREAKIETALERVRSRTMAMQKTDELLEAAELVHKELSALGINSMNVSYAFVDEDEQYGSYYSINPVDGKIMPVPFTFPHTETEVMRSILSGWKKQEPLHVIELNEAETLQHQTYIGEHIQQQLAKNNIPFALEEFLKISPKKAVLSTFNFSKGYLFNIGGERLSKTQEELMLRFTRVFEQTYTRFLDLQKAEAQSREAQIELGLERVRARAMAMQKSDELRAIIATVSNELAKLDVVLDRCFIVTYDLGTMGSTWWMSNPETPNEPIALFIKYHNYPVYLAYIDAWKIRKLKWEYVLEGETKKNWDKFLFVETELSQLPSSVIENMRSKEKVYLSSSFNNFGYLSLATLEPLTDEQFDILVRFARVFDLTYTRFNDLQKAEAQAREAQIELGLERVRARAMAMQGSAELSDVIQTVYAEFTRLDISLDRCFIMIFDSQTNGATWWMADQVGSFTQKGLYVQYHEYRPHLAYLEAWHERREKWQYILEGKEKKDWDEYIFSETELRQLPDLIVSNMKAFDRAYISASFNNFGCITTGSLQPLTQESFDILLRFSKVFDSTYTRFSDLQKAEAQTRESQIELGLERVRARAMAMQTSDELKELIGTVFTELTKLDLILTRCLIMIYEPETKGSTWWMANSEAPADPMGLYIKYHEHPPYTAYINAWQERKNKWEYILEGTDKKEWDDFLFTETELSHLPHFVIQGMKEPGKVYLNASFNSFGNLTLASLEPLSNEHFDIMLRFAKVFDLTYTRFNDLKQAEAQAREAQIELGLERVRARAMAMQKSDELSELVDTVFKELTKLDFALTWCIINIIDESSLTNTVWAANPDIDKAPESYYMKFEDYPYHHAMLKDWKERKAKSVYTLEADEKRVYDDYLFSGTEFKRTPEVAQAASRAMEKYVCSFSFSNFGGLQTVGDAPLSEASLDILSRFGKVFDLTYTRFNDLKKAEAQAKESQIQLALERVRARTMAMQKSDELREAVLVIYEQLKLLSFDSNACNIIIIDKESGSAQYWVSGFSQEIFPVCYNVPYLNHPYAEALLRPWRQGDKYIVYEYSGKLKQSFDEMFFTQTDFRNVPEEAKRIMTRLKSVKLSTAFISYGALQVLGPEPLSAENAKILQRFGKVFEQTYTRFLDLQKAEAQARESQIQLALERVRARTMAMQRSDELADVATSLFQQVKALGVPQWVCGFNIWEIGDKEFTWYPGSPDGEILTPCKVPLTEHPVFISMDESRKRGDELFVYEKEGEFQAGHYRYMMSVPGMRNLLQNMLDAGLSFPTFQIDHVANFSHGNLLFITYEPVPEMHDVFKRFAKVFDQTYTRFLDLQKAEAQAREAQIELALERVRARTMAMQRSDELADAALLLYREFGSLSINTFTCGYMFIDEEKQTQTGWFVLPDGSFLPNFIVFPLMGDNVLDTRYKDWKEKKPIHIHEVQGEINKEHHRFLSNYVPSFVKENIFSRIPDRIIFNCANFSDGYLLILSTEHFSPKEQQTIIRFAKVFEQTYTRFLDLQKAEAQAKEAQIETALERVRSRTMGMQKSEELKEIIKVVYEQLVHLNINVEHAGFIMDYKERDDMHIWLADQRYIPSQATIPYFDSPHWNSFVKAKENGQDFFTNLLSFEEKNKFYTGLFQLFPVPDDAKEYYFNCAGLAISTVLLDSVGLYIENFSGTPYSDEENNTLMRFGKVFQQTYTRFNDLQKAEAQARQARIEAAMEKVRSRAMAMQKPHELIEVAELLRKEMGLLGVEELETSSIYIHHEDTGKTECWYAIKDVQHPEKELVADHMTIDLHETSVGKQMLEFYRSNQKQISIPMQGNARREWINYCAGHSKVLIGFYGDNIPDRTYHLQKFSNGYMGAASPGDISPESWDLLRRATSVFSLAYTRFSDLQQAEAQAREAKIEAALERVRSRTMAMQKSAELAQASTTLFEQLNAVVPNLWVTGFVLCNKDKNIDEWWLTGGSGYFPDLYIPNTGDALHEHMYQHWLDGDSYYQEIIEGEPLQQHYNWLMTIPSAKAAFDAQAAAGIERPVWQQLHCAYFSQGYLSFITLQPINESQVFKRFAQVFNQTYTRFLDLQKAEAQAREATIEAALERVRGKAMAMHSSTDLATTIGVFYYELEGLNLTPRRCGVGLIDKEKHTAEISTMNATANGQSIELVGVLDMNSHPVLKAVYNNWLTKKDYQPVLHGNEIKEYYQVVRPQIDFPDYPNDSVQYGYFFFFDEGGVYAWTEKELQEDELKIYRRFTSVLSLTYKRYKDLRDAETRARVAVKDAALDRIRADIASMRTINDLDRITPLIWNELTILGIPFIRCGVFIMDEEQQLIHTFLSTPDGKAIAAFHLHYTTPGSIQQVLSSWQNKTNYIAHWDELEFAQFADILVQQGTLASAEQYLKTIPKGGFYLHFLPFLQGMLYVGNTTQLKEEEIELIQHVADAFSTAYARYEDFNKLDAAKKQVDKTLTDLKQAQTQLIQSEKMASLGQLTAGIAHEIQNPLNFVNNFSEVSKELLHEMKEAIENGDAEEAKDIMSNVIQNLEKINHHGKRADGIVKGMLQHSRSSANQKEPTNINALADEYLRLAYHGLRAKDKTFNATLETDYDETIGKVDVIPQDIGRVILNLITNAFYAANEKQKTIDLGGLANDGSAYVPTVSVITKNLTNKVEIKITDNGNGIPQNIVDKIFQPFFTTKPTGQGTGLGLSLAYDIIKAHGGELNVETIEGIETRFIIWLPI